MTDLPRIALSIRQPWAWAILHAGKDVENRTWYTLFRGPVAIHAAKDMTAKEITEFSKFLGDLQLARSVASSVKGPHYGSLPRGGIVGVAEITGCVNRSGSPWFFGPWGFTIANARPVDFIPCKGALGFFEWQEEAETRERML